MRFRVSILAVLTCTLLAAGCQTPFASPYQNYAGDGVLTDLQGHAGPFIRGYEINMPEFDLAEAQTFEYRLASVPNIGKKCGVYLAIAPRNGKIVQNTEAFDGKLTLELVDSKGNVVTKVDGRLGDYTWAQGGQCELYQSDKSFFMTDPASEYRLLISYSPDSKLAGLKGHVCLRSGGRR